MDKRHSIRITTNTNDMDLKLIYNFLSNESYWAKNRSYEIFKISIDNSLCFGILINNIQAGFARIVTDHSTFAYLCDVFVLEKYRKNGYATLLIKYILTYNKLQNVPRIYLITKDAQDLYVINGFKNFEHPKRIMYFDLQDKQI